MFLTFFFLRFKIVKIANICVLMRKKALFFEKLMEIELLVYFVKFNCRIVKNDKNLTFFVLVKKTSKV